jgi:hypothetical protein
VVSQFGGCYLLSQFGYAIMFVIARQFPPVAQFGFHRETGRITERETYAK